MARRVLVTGRGVVAPHSDDVDALFDALLEGRSAVRPHPGLRPDRPPHADRPPRCGIPVDVPDAVGPIELRTRSLRFVAAAARSALADAGLPGKSDAAPPSRRLAWVTTGPETDALEAIRPARCSTPGRTEDVGRKRQTSAPVWGDRKGRHAWSGERAR